MLVQTLITLSFCFIATINSAIINKDPSFELSTHDNANPVWKSLSTSPEYVFCDRFVCPESDLGPATGDWFLWLTGKYQGSSGLITQTFWLNNCSSALWTRLYIAGDLTVDSYVAVRVNDEYEKRFRYDDLINSYVMFPFISQGNCKCKEGVCGRNTIAIQWHFQGSDQVWIDDLVILGLDQ